MYSYTGVPRPIDYKCKRFGEDCEWCVLADKTMHKSFRDRDEKRKSDKEKNKRMKRRVKKISRKRYRQKNEA